GGNRTQPAPRLPKWNWLLVLQLLAVLLIAVALSRPQIGGSTGTEHRVHVLDVSGSMSTTDLDQELTRFEASVAAIQADINSLDPSVPTRLSLITVAEKAQPVAVRFDNVQAFEQALVSVQPSDGVAVTDQLPDLLDAITREDEATPLFYHADTLAEDVAALPSMTFVGQGRADTPNAGLRA